MKYQIGASKLCHQTKPSLSLVPREAGLHVVGMCSQEDQICLNTPRPLSLQEEDLKSGHIFYGLPPPRPRPVEKGSAASRRRCEKQPETHVVLCYMYT